MGPNDVDSPAYVSEIIELNHCPFCGYLDIDFKIIPSPMGRRCEAVCLICGASVSGLGVMAGDASYDNLKANAVTAWNRRSDPREDDDTNPG